MNFRQILGFIQKIFVYLPSISLAEARYGKGGGMWTYKKAFI